MDYIIFLATKAGNLEYLEEPGFLQSTLRSDYYIGIVDSKDCRSYKTVHATATGEGWQLWLPLPYVFLFYFGRDTPEPANLDEEVVHELASRIVEEIAPSTEGSRVRFVLLDANMQED